MMEEKYYIIYPNGDRKKLKVHTIESFEPLEDYTIASRKCFSDQEEAVKYAKHLADENKLKYVGTTEGYLD